MSELVLHQEVRCREKTKNGTVFSTERLAYKRARQLSKKTGLWIKEFHCSVCNKWHVGKATRTAINKIYHRTTKENAERRKRGSTQFPPPGTVPLKQEEEN